MSPCHDGAVPFNHNDHYHDVLLRELPTPCRRALDVGCGNGKFARRLALRGIEVDAVDVDSDVIATAQNQTSALELPARIHFDQVDITRVTLPPNTYDYISCLASIHHVPIETVQKLRDSLTENGVLVILGCYREVTIWDRAVSLLAVPVNAALRVAVFAWEKRSGFSTSSTREPPSAPTYSPSMSLAEIREFATTRLPRSRIRRLLFWRYLLVFRNNGEWAAR